VDTQSYYPIFNSGKRNLLNNSRLHCGAAMGQEKLQRCIFSKKPKPLLLLCGTRKRAAKLVNIRHWPAKSLLEFMIGAQKGQYTLAELRPVRLCRSGYTNLAGGNCIDKQ
jgi:hypothetical protein